MNNKQKMTHEQHEPERFKAHREMFEARQRNAGFCRWMKSRYVPDTVGKPAKLLALSPAVAAPRASKRITSITGERTMVAVYYEGPDETRKGKIVGHEPPYTEEEEHELYRLATYKPGATFLHGPRPPAVEPPSPPAAPIPPVEK
jgi:hypothetical protein